VDHLLLHFEVACAIWNVFFSRIGLSLIMPRQVVDLYACWWTASNTLEYCCVEDGAFVPFVVFMEEIEG
jgi:hypothetical protein